jgi:hypothetical protein
MRRLTSLTVLILTGCASVPQAGSIIPRPVRDWRQVATAGDRDRLAYSTGRRRSMANSPRSRAEVAGVCGARRIAMGLRLLSIRSGELAN